MGLDRSAYLTETHDATVITLPFFLHPEVPQGGTHIRELFNIEGDDRRVRTYPQRLASLAEEANLDFDPPDHIPRTLAP